MGLGAIKVTSCPSKQPRSKDGIPALVELPGQLDRSSQRVQTDWVTVFISYYILYSCIGHAFRTLIVTDLQKMAETRDFCRLRIEFGHHFDRDNDT